MPNLNFPNGTFPFRLSPSGRGSGVQGRILLDNSSGNRVKLQVAAGDSNYVSVTIRAASRTSLVLDPFVIPVPQSGTTESWEFGDLAISNSTGNAICVMANTVRVRDTHGNAEEYRFSGLPDTGIEAPESGLSVETRLHGYIGDLLISGSGAQRRIDFVPPNGPRSQVRVTGSRIAWDYNGARFRGDRFAFAINENSAGVVVSHGYAGEVNPTRSRKKRSDDDWEAKAAYPLSHDAESIAVTANGLDYPVGTYRMIITPPLSSAKGMTRRVDSNGFVELKIVDGKRAITFYSGASKPVTIEVQYGSNRPAYGTILGFTVCIRSEEWSFGSIEVFMHDGVAFLQTVDLAIGVEGKALEVVSLSGFPLSEIPVPKSLAVRRNGKGAGGLVLADHASGRFEKGPGVSGAKPVRIHDQTTIFWATEDRLWFGFPTIRAVSTDGMHKTPEIGYVGTTMLLGPGPNSEDDWEASASPHPQDDGRDRSNPKG